jgi:hypothetical protein
MNGELHLLYILRTYTDEGLKRPILEAVRTCFFFQLSYRRLFRRFAFINETWKRWNER